MRSIFFHCSYGNPIDIHSAIARTSSARGMWQSLYRFLHASKYSRYFQSEAIGILYLISIFHSRTMIFHWFHHMLQAISLRLFNSSPMWLYIWVLDHTCAINLPPVPRSPFPNNGLNPVCESVCVRVCVRVCVWKFMQSHKPPIIIKYGERKSSPRITIVDMHLCVRQSFDSICIVV